MLVEVLFRKVSIGVDFEPKGTVMNMKKLLAFILSLCFVILTVSCGHTVEKPLITEDVEISDQHSTVNSGSKVLPNQRTWDDWAKSTEDKSTVILKVKKVASDSYYWGDKNGVGGITDTRVVLQEVLVGSTEKFPTLSVGGEFHLSELFTVDKIGRAHV